MDYILSFIAGGLTQATWWQVVVFTLVVTHITIVSVTVFLHRSQAHRSLDLHPAVMHFFRFWLWMTTGMVTKEWVAIHRKHHAKCERKAIPIRPSCSASGRCCSVAPSSTAKNQQQGNHGQVRPRHA